MCLDTILSKCIIQGIKTKMEIKRMLVRCEHFGKTSLLLLLIFLRHTDAYDYYRSNPSSIPSFLPVPTIIAVHEGETANLRCRIYNLGPKFVVWRKADEESPLTLGKMTFTPDKDIEVQIEDINPHDEQNGECRYDLIIKNVSKDQEGIYACQISATNNYTLNITLNVLEPINYSPELGLTGTEYVSLMEDIRLVYNATGVLKAPDSVDWFFDDGEPISETKPKWFGRILQLNRIPLPGRSLISELVIKRVTTDDRGHYVCRLTQKLAKGFKVHVLNDKRIIKIQNEIWKRRDIH